VDVVLHLQRVAHRRLVLEGTPAWRLLGIRVRLGIRVELLHVLMRIKVDFLLTIRVRFTVCQLGLIWEGVQVGIQRVDGAVVFLMHIHIQLHILVRVRSVSHLVVVLVGVVFQRVRSALVAESGGVRVRQVDRQGLGRQHVLLRIATRHIGT